MVNKLFVLAASLALAAAPFAASASTTKGIDAGLTAKMKGSILLQVQQHGEAWYVNPKDGQRYYMKDGDAAYQMMRNFGVGIADADLVKIATVSDTTEMKNSQSSCSSNALASRLKGDILLQVQQHGEAWYVNPSKCRAIYLKDGAAAYSIMRFLGLGIADADLGKIATGTAVSASSTNQTPSAQESQTPASTGPKTTFGDGTFVVGTDIAPGTYRNSGGSSCYYARLSGFSGELKDILANDNASAPAIVTVAAGDKGFQSSRCGTWSQVGSASGTVAGSGSASNSATSSASSVTGSQTIPSLTWISVIAKSYATDLGVGITYSSGSGAIDDQSAYQVPVSVEIKLLSEGYDEKVGQPVLGTVLVDRKFTDSQIQRSATDKMLFIGIPFADNDMTRLVSSSATLVAVQVTLTTALQGSFSASANDVLLASGASMVNHVNLSGGVTWTGPVLGPIAQKHFYLDKGLLSFTETNAGEDNVFMWLVRADGYKDLIVNEIGQGTRNDTDQISTPGWYYLLVQSPGDWSIDMTQSIY